MATTISDLAQFRALCIRHGGLVQAGMAACVCGVCTKRIYQLGRSGRLTAYAYFGAYYFPLDELTSRR